VERELRELAAPQGVGDALYVRTDLMQALGVDLPARHPSDDEGVERPRGGVAVPLMRLCRRKRWCAAAEKSRRCVRRVTLESVEKDRNGDISEESLFGLAERAGGRHGASLRG
jgi:hypothetical protein